MPLEELLTGLSRDRRDAIQSAIDFAELSLSSEDPSEALAVAGEVLAELVGMNAPDLFESAFRLRASAREAAGDLDGAIHRPEGLLTAVLLADMPVGQGPDLAEPLPARVRPTRRGDRGGGRSDKTQIERLGLTETTEAIQLTVTTAGGLYVPRRSGPRTADLQARLGRCAPGTACRWR